MFLPVNFAKCQKGVSAIIFAIALVPILVLIGAAINYSDGSSKGEMMKQLLDSAVLAAASAKDVSDEERVKLAQQHFASAMPGQLADLDKQVAFSVSDGDVTGTIQTTIPSPIMGLFGLADAKLNEKAVATFKEENRQLDMVFCIDATGSMQNTIDAVRDRAVSLQQQLNDELDSRGFSKFAAMRVRVIFFRDYGYDQGDPHDYRDYKTPVVVRYFVDKNYVLVDEKTNTYAPVNPLMQAFSADTRYMPADHPTDTVEVAVDDVIKTMTVNEAISAGISNPFPGASNLPAMRESKGGDFYTLSDDSSNSNADERTDFQDFVAREKASGGGDEPEAGFACLNNAIRSHWAHVDRINPDKSDDLAGHKGHKITTLIPMVVLWTDANALPLDGMADGLSERNPYYPSSAFLPHSISGLTANWNDQKLIDQKDKLFVFFGNKNNSSPMCADENGNPAGPACTSYRSNETPPRWRALDSWQKSETGGSLTEGNTNLVNKLVDALALSPAMPRLID